MNRYKLRTAHFHAVRQLEPPEGRSFKVTAMTQSEEDASTIGRTANELNDKRLDKALSQASDAAIARHFMQQCTATSLLTLHSGLGAGASVNNAGETSHIVTLRLEAAHYLPKVPPQHRCHRLHGHSYILQCELTEDTPELLKLQQRLDRRCLNDIPGLSNPTCEMFAAWLWQQVPHMKAISVRETPSSGCFHDGKKFFIWRSMRMESAIRTGTSCYGHSYQARLHLQGPLDSDMGWVMDFGDMKRALAPIHARLDHHTVTELPGIEAPEDLPDWLYRSTKNILPQITRLELEAPPGTGTIICEPQAAHLPPATGTQP